MIRLLLLLALTPAAALAQPTFFQSFSPDQIGPGSATTLTFQIGNSSASRVTNLAFTNNLPGGVTIATPSSASTTCGIVGLGGDGRPGADTALSAPEGGSTISFSGGTVNANASCSVSVNVTSSTAGTVTNTSSSLTSSAGNSGTSSDDLTVTATRPGFSKSFSPSTVGFGERSTLTFTIDNLANSQRIANLDFTDSFPDGLEVADPANASTTCRGTSASNSTTLTAVPGESSVTLDANGFNSSGFETLAPGATCTVTVDVVARSAGTLVNTVDLLADFQPAGTATAQLNVTTPAELAISTSFEGDPVAPGGTPSLRITLTNRSRTGAATGISFTDDLEATLSGLQATGPAVGCGSTLTGISVLSFSGGSLGAGQTCVLEVPLQVPGGAVFGRYTDVTSAVSGQINGRTVTGAPARADLFVEAAPAVRLTKTFRDNPVAPGSTTRLQFTISASSAASDISFTDVVASYLPSSVRPVLPANGFCGPGSTASINSVGGQDVLTFQGGSLAANASCTFEVVLDVPAGSTPGTFTNTTSELTATVGGQSVTSPAATDDITVVGSPRLTKSFDSAVTPGGTVTLGFSLSLEDEAPAAATAISFTDDLEAVLTGLVATGTPIAACGGTLTGTSTLTLTGATITPGQTCDFDVDLAVPAGATSGTYTNTTSTVSATVSGLAVQGAPASADVVVSALAFSKAFSRSPMPGESVDLTFTIENLGANAATSIVFTDNLSAVLSGLTANATPPVLTGCGGGSLSGTTFLIFSGGEVAANGTCTATVTLDVPAGAIEGTYRNVTSNLTATIDGANATIPPATAVLEVVEDAPPALAKAFMPASIPTGGTSTVTLTIDNTTSTSAATALDVTDAFPSGLEVAATPNAATTCTSGTLTAVAGAGQFSYTGGTVAAGASCAITVDVTSAAAGEYANTTGALTSSAGNSGTATATLVVRDVQIAATKTDAIQNDDGDGQADRGETIRYTIVVGAGARNVSGVTFADALGTGLELVVGSVTTSQGSVTSGNGAGDSSVGVNVGTVQTGSPVTITLDAVVSNSLSSAATQVCNQGSLNGSFPTSLTDDPDTVDLDDATCSVVAAQPVASFSSATISGDEGTTIGLTVTLDAPASGNESVEVRLTGGDGADVDGYTTTTVSFAATETSKDVTITITDDNVAEGAEDITFTLQNPSGVTLGPPSSTVLTINPSVSDVAFASASYSGTEGTPATITVTVPVAAAGGETVDVVFTGGGAGATAADLGGVTTRTATFVANATTASVSFPVTADGIAEGVESFTFQLQNPSGLEVGTPDEAILEVGASVSDVAFSVAAVSGDEGDTVTLTVAVPVDAAGGETVDVVFTGGGSADATGADIGGFTTKTATFVSGERTASVTVDVTADGIAEGSETFTFELQNPSGVAIGAQDETVLTVRPSVSAVAFASATYAATEGTDLEVTLTLPVPATGNETIDLEVATGDPDDLDGTVIRTVTFDAGDQSKVVRIAVADDRTAEPAEDIVLELVNPVNLEVGTPSRATVTIGASVSDVQFQSATYVAVEGDVVDVTVTVPVAATGGETVDIVFTGGGSASATAADLDNFSTATATFGAGDLTATVPVTVTDDMVTEGQETFTFELRNPSGVIIGSPDETVLTVALSLTSVRFAQTAYSAAEGTAAGLVISLAAPAIGGEQVEVELSGDATDLDGYTTQTVVFAQGETQKTLSVPVTADGFAEAQETFTFTLANAQGLTIRTPDEAVLTVAPSLTEVRFASTTVSALEGDEAVLTVSLRAPAVGGEQVTVAFASGATPNATAADLDGFTTQTVTFAAGETSRTVRVPITADGLTENAEAFTFELRGAVDLTIGTPNQAVVTVAASLPNISFAVAQRAVNEGEGPYVLDLELSDDVAVDATATVRLTDGDPADVGGFTQKTFTLTPSGVAGPLSVTIPIVDDAVPEGSESFVFTIEVTGGLEEGTTTSSVLIVIDNDGERIAVTVPATDADNNGVEDGGLRAFALPVGGLTVGEVALAAGADSVYVVGLDGSLVAADLGRSLPAGAPVVVDVAPGAELTFSGSAPPPTVPFAEIPVDLDGDDQVDRLLAGIGNPLNRALDLEAVTVENGTLTDVVLVFDAPSGSFRPVSVSGLEADDLALEPFGVVIAQVTPDGDLEDVVVTLRTERNAASGAVSIEGALFTPTDDETAVVLALRPAEAGAVPPTSRPASAPGDVFAMRIGVGLDGLDMFDGLDLVSPLGGTLAARPDGLEAVPFAALSIGDLQPGAVVTVPLSVAVPVAGSYEIILDSEAAMLRGRPVIVEIVDSGAPTTVSDGTPFAFSVASDGPVDGLSVRVSLGTAVSGETSLEGGPILSVYPNPSAGTTTVELSVLEAGDVRVVVYDALGREVARLHDATAPAGLLRLEVADGLAPGAYVIRADSTSANHTRPFTVVR